MLRLSPSTIRTTLRPRLSASPARAAHSSAWQPGQAILFGSQTTAASEQMRRSSSASSAMGEALMSEGQGEQGEPREWAPGDPIRFGGADEGAVGMHACVPPSFPSPRRLKRRRLTFSPPAALPRPNTLP
jgi:hypothetical protein